MAVQYAFGKIITQGLDLNVDAADPTSYPGSGTSWTNVVNRSITGSLISCSFSSDFKGGIVFASPSASTVFPGTVANYGTGSFTIEMAFRPTQINGIHYLVSKNSGSFPNWGVYLSGSGGSGKLWTEYRISSTVSCSYSSSTTFTTGSNYSADITFAPFVSGAITYVNGLIDSSLSQQAGGSLTSTASLFLGNTLVSSSFSFSGSIYNIKIYSSNFGLNANQIQTNYNLLNYRMSLPRNTNFRTLDILLVGGGGGAGMDTLRQGNGGGGAGGVLRNTTAIIPVNTVSIPVVVGAGGAMNSNGGPTYLFNRLDLTAFGGGRGVGPDTVAPTIGGSGGGGSIYTRSGTFYNYPGALGIEGQGNAGGSGETYVSGGASSGGGGGAGSAGFPGTSTKGGDGGSGSYFPEFVVVGRGSPVGWFGGGGGGNAGDGQTMNASPGSGGIGGGAASGGKNGGTGVANTGGGGGAAGWNNNGGTGGSGITVIRYPGTPIATGGVILQSGSYTYHTFTSSGNFTFL